MDMKIFIGELIKKKSAQMDVHLNVDIQRIDDGIEEIEVKNPVKVDGVIYVAEEIIIFEAHIETELELTCSRCLQPFIMKFENDVNEKFTLNEGHKDDDVNFMDSDSIDITKIITDDIILSLPIKRLCKDDCKGLCQVCGANLNTTTCSCNKNEIDPRLAKLKDIFFTN